MEESRVRARFRCDLILRFTVFSGFHRFLLLILSTLASSELALAPGWLALLVAKMATSVPGPVTATHHTVQHKGSLCPSIPSAKPEVHTNEPA